MYLMQTKSKNKKRFSGNKILGASGICLAIFVLVWQFSQAQETSTSISQLSDQQKSENQEKLEELERRARLYREIIDIKRKQQTTLNDQIAIMDTKIEQVSTEIEINKRKSDELDQKIKNLQDDIAIREKTLETQRKILAELMQAYYQTSQQNIFRVVFADVNFASFISQKDKLAQVSERITSIANTVSTMREKLIADRDELDKKRTEIVNVHYDLQDKNASLESAQMEKQNLLDKTKGEETRYQQLLIKTKEQIQEEIEKIEMEKSGLDLGPLPPSKPGLFIYPVNPVIITQGYGKTSFSSNYSSGKHNGIDFSVDYKSIYAAGNGKVIEVGDNGKYAYGKWVAISHGNGLVTLYGHFSKVIVDKGDVVKSGETIGISGNTGFSTGPHLHFTVFAEKTFELVESTVVKGLMLPTGASLNPKNYL